MASEKRQNRVAEQVRKEIGSIILRSYNSLSAVTVTEVKPSRDLSTMRVYVSIMAISDDEREAILKKLYHHNKDIRRALASRLRIRAVPLLRFQLDDSLDRSETVNHLLSMIQDERAVSESANSDDNTCKSDSSENTNAEDTNQA
jgi:ribosome-binding factor A